MYSVSTTILILIYPRICFDIFHGRMLYRLMVGFKETQNLFNQKITPIQNRLVKVVFCDLKDFRHVGMAFQLGKFSKKTKFTYSNRIKSYIMHFSNLFAQLEFFRLLSNFLFYICTKHFVYNLHIFYISKCSRVVEFEHFVKEFISINE